MNKKHVTKKGYKYKLLQLIREYNPKNKNNLDVLITDVDKIITFLKKPEHHPYKQKGFYSPIVKFICYLPFDIATIGEAYRKYKAFLDSLAKYVVYADHDEDYYKYYNYDTLRNILHEIMKNKPNDL